MINNDPSVESTNNKNSNLPNKEFCRMEAKRLYNVQNQNESTDFFLCLAFVDNHYKKNSIF